MDINQVDSYRFVSGFTAKMVKTWAAKDAPAEIGWTPLQKPLNECNVAMLSSAAIALKEDEPFDQQTERDNPWWGDPSFRIIPRGTETEQVCLYHLHITTSYGESDLNCVLPLDHLEAAEQAGRIGAVADSHYSMMGYILNPNVLLSQSVPAMIRSLRAENVDVVVLVPT